jgi:spore coat protein U-like protein
MKLNKKIVTALAATVAVFGSVSAQAATATATVQVTATILPSCILTVADVTLGTYTASEATDKTGNGSIKVTCSRSLPYTVDLDGGVSLNAKARTLKNGTNVLNYGVVYGSANFDADNKISMTGVANTGVETNYTIKVTVPTAQYVPAGTYEDTLTATVTY